MLKWSGATGKTARLLVIAALVLGAATVAFPQNNGDSTQKDHSGEHEKGDRGQSEKVLYIWAQDQAHVAPDFLAVIDFDEQSPEYGRVIDVVPLPPPGNIGNEPHHCHLNSNKKTYRMRRNAQPAERSEWNFLLQRG